MIDERREYQRLNLTKPLDGWFGDFAVELVDVSASGAQIVHDDPLPEGARGLLRFTWRGEDIELTAEVARTMGQRSGLAFVDDSPILRQHIEISALELLRAREANATGDRARNVIGDETLTAASAGARALRGYLVYELNGNQWTCRVAVLPNQPPNGFTVAANESEEQIDLLRKTFESGGEEERKMTRMIAQLSVTR